MRREVAILLVFFISTSCATAPMGRIRLPQTGEFLFEPKDTYTIKTGGGAYWARGSELIWKENQLTYHADGSEKNYPADQIREIVGESHQRTGSYAGRGAGIGVVSGALTGLIIAATAGGCKGADEPDDCEALQAVGYILGIPFFSGVGALLGAGIGFAIPKKGKMILTPTVSQKGGETSEGLSFSMVF